MGKKAVLYTSFGVVLAAALLGIMAMFSIDANAAGPADWDNTSLPSAGADFVVDGPRDVLYVSMPALNAIGVVNASTGSLLRQIPTHGAPQGLALSPSGAKLFVALNGAGSIDVVNLTTELATQVNVSTQLGTNAAWDVFAATNDVVLVSGNAGAGVSAYIVKVDLVASTQTRVASARVIKNAPEFTRAGPTHVVIGEGGTPNSLYKLSLTSATMPIVAEDVHGSLDGSAQTAQASPDGMKVYVQTQIRLGSTLALSGSPSFNGTPAPTPDGSRVVYLTGSGGVRIVNTTSQTLVRSGRTACDPSAASLPTSAVKLRATNDSYFVLNGTGVCAGSAIAIGCSAISSVATGDELNFAIDCYNVQVPSGSHVMSLTASIDLTGKAIPTINPVGAQPGGVSLTINGTGGDLVGATLTTSGTATTIIDDLIIRSGAAPSVVVTSGELEITNSVLFGPLSMTSGTAMVSDTGFFSHTANGIDISNASITITRSAIGANAGHGIAASNAEVTIVNSGIWQNGLDGIHELPASTTLALSVSGSDISKNGGDGVDVSGATALISNSTIYDNTVAGVAAAGGSTTIAHTTISSNATGIRATVNAVTLESSLLLNLVGASTTVADDCSGTITSANSVAFEATCGTGITQLTTADIATFGTYGDKGCDVAQSPPFGCTSVLEVLPGNPAAGAGTCTNVPLRLGSNEQPVFGTLTMDQRHKNRPNGDCSAGAFELAKVFITAPISGSQLPCGPIDLTWDGPSTGNYAIHAGKTATTNEYVFRTVGAVNTFTIKTFPVDGEDIFLRLWHKPVDGAWMLFDQHQYKACEVVVNITNPVPASQLACGATELIWNGPTAGDYAIHAGASATSREYVNRTVGAVNNFSISSFPIDGSDIFVRLWYRPTGGAWAQVETATYQACELSIDFLTPPNLSQLACGGVELTWDGPAVGDYAIHAGATPATIEYVYRSVGTVNSFQVSTFPIDGSNVSVRLWYRPVGGAWSLVDTNTYQACELPISITTPIDQTTLPCGNVEIAWDGPADGTYAIHAGATTATTEYMLRSIGPVTSFNVPNFPIDGSNVSVRLWYRPDGGVWRLVDTNTYQACDLQIDITTPVNLATLPCGATTFNWTGPASGNYAIHAGATATTTEYAKRSVGPVNTFTLSTLPTDGSNVSVRLWYQPVGATWSLVDSNVYTACTVTVNITAPADLTVLSCGDVTLTWTGNVPGTYAIHAGATATTREYVNRTVGSATSDVITSFPSDGSDIFVRVWFRPTGGVYQLGDSVQYTACT